MIQTHELAIEIEATIESADIFINADSDGQTEILDDMIDMLERWKDMIISKSETP